MFLLLLLLLLLQTAVLPLSQCSAPYQKLHFHERGLQIRDIVVLFLNLLPAPACSRYRRGGCGLRLSSSPSSHSREQRSRHDASL
jgi:hypothetical protein